MSTPPSPLRTSSSGKRSRGPRSLAHRGTVRATGFLFDSDLIGRAEARQRILSLWTAGARVYRADDDGRLFAILLPTSVDVASDRAPGAPLVQSGTATGPGAVVTSAPLTAEEIERLAPPPSALVLVRGGQAAVVTLTPERLVDPADWLDLTRWEVASAESLGRVPEAPKPAVDEVRTDVREILTGIPAASEEAEDFTAALRGEKVRRRKSKSRRTGRARFRLLAGAGIAGSVLGALSAVGQMGRTAVSAVAGVGSRWRNRRAERAAKTGGTSGRSSARRSTAHSSTRQSSAAADAITRGLLFVLDPFIVAAVWVQVQFERLFPPSEGAVRESSQRPAPAGGAPPPDSWTLRLLEQISRSARALSTRMLFRSGLAQALGRRQAAHLDRMMKMFRDGNLDEALRHAIPLGGADGLEARLALGTPGVRDDLQIQLSHGPGSALLASGPELFEALRKLYRQAFEQLVDAGRTDEAAFVLAELLHADEEAVQFLEVQGKVKLAAELAEARGLPPGLVVRQWWAAREWERAVLYARRMGAFADAVTRLEKSAPDEAAKLRLLWADSLAESGDYGAAVETIWPLTEARSIAAEWIERGIAVGGPSSGRLLARKLELLPDSFADVRARVMELMDDTSADLAPVRRAFAVALSLGSNTDAARALARPSIRALVRDASVAVDELPDSDFRRLVSFAGDAALRSDLPPLPKGNKRSWLDLQEGRVLRIEESDTGTAVIHDAALLPDGKMLVALGEAGLRLLNREGRALVHWDHPAHHLVLSDKGDRAIFHSPRGESARLGRVDLVTRRAAYWCDAPLVRWAKNYDGSAWFVASGRDFAMIDATAKGWTSMWHRAGLGPAVMEIQRTERACWVLVCTIEDRDEWGNPSEPWAKWEKWVFSLPGPTLDRQVGTPDLDNEPGVQRWRCINEEGFRADLMGLPSTADFPPSFEWKLFVDGWGEKRLYLAITTPMHEPKVLFTGDWCVAMVPDIDSARLVLARKRANVARLDIKLSGTATPSIRLTNEHALVGDDGGRLIVADLRTGLLVRNLRLYL